VLEAYEPLEEPYDNPLTTHIYTFNTSFQQIFKMFNKLVDELDKHPRSYDQKSIPNIINVVNEIRRIQSTVGEKDWRAARTQRNLMAHDYPRLPVLWEVAWGPLKRVIEPVGHAVQRLFATIPQMQQQLEDVRTVR
jgi:hypothetical protein